MSILLETERLLFRPHEESDLDAYAEMTTAPEFRRLSGGKPLSPTEAAESLRSILTGQQPLLQSPPGPMGLFATVLKSENRYPGRCVIYPNATTAAPQHKFTFFADIGIGFKRACGCRFFLGRWTRRALVLQGLGTAL